MKPTEEDDACEVNLVNSDEDDGVPQVASIASDANWRVADRERHTAVLSTVLIMCAIMHFAGPYITYTVRASHIHNDDYQAVANGDSHILAGLRTQRDLPWEIWTSVHTSMENASWSYYIFTALIMMTTCCLWWMWFPVRLVAYRKLQLGTTLLILQAVSLAVNILSQFPPPPGFLQYEPEMISYAFGIVTQGGIFMVSERAAWSILLWHDVMREAMPSHRRVSLVLTLGYWFLICLYLWSTHQMFSFSLIVNLLLALAAYSASDRVFWKVEKTMRIASGHERHPVHLRNRPQQGLASQDAQPALQKKKTKKVAKHSNGRNGTLARGGEESMELDAYDLEAGSILDADA